MTTFTFEHYRQILSLIQEQEYRFVSFDQAFEDWERACLLRHDVDASPFCALNLAQIEADQGIKATYFFLLRATSYNLFCLEVRHVVQKILSLGHDLGLHVMTEGLTDFSEESLCCLIKKEIQWLSEEFGTSVRAYSWHQPSKDLIQKDLRLPYVNTYAVSLSERYRYLSDSSLQWGEDPPEVFFKQPQNTHVQFLTHPVWWTEHSLSVTQKWALALQINQEKIIQHWNQRENSLAKNPLFLPK
jgi:hypothetical protein